MRDPICNDTRKPCNECGCKDCKALMAKNPSTVERHDPQGVLTVADIIRQLQTLPQDAEVWMFWDEGCHYYPRKEQCFRFAEVEEIRPFSSNNRLVWDEVETPGTGRNICVI